MARTKTRLANGEIEILQVVWSFGQCGLREVYDALLQKRQIALSTVAVRIGNMEKKGLIEAVDARRPKVYRAKVEQQDTSEDVVRDVINRVFNGSAVRLIQHVLLRNRKKLSEEDRKAVRAQLDKLK